jgi:hypothetical protein
MVAIVAHSAFAGRGDAVVRLSGRWIRYPREAYELLAMAAMIFQKLSGIVAVIASALYARGKNAWSTSYKICLLIALTGGFFAVQELTSTSNEFFRENSVWLSTGGAVLASFLWAIIVRIKLEDKAVSPNDLKIVVPCVRCGQKLRLRLGQSGYVRCPSCNHSFYKET